MEAEYVSLVSSRFLSEQQINEALNSMRKKTRLQICEWGRTWVFFLGGGGGERRRRRCIIVMLLMMMMMMMIMMMMGRIGDETISEERGNGGRLSPDD